MKQTLINIEKHLDEKARNLSIYGSGFQSVYSSILFAAETIDYKGDKDTSMDYLGRTSLIYPLIKKQSARIETLNTTEALLKLQENPKFIDEINFLNAYAHFSMLMPQIHRGTLIVKSIDQNRIVLDFPNENVLKSEVIDKLYTAQSLPISFSSDEIFRRTKELTDKKAQNRNFDINNEDFALIKGIYRFHLYTQVNVEVLSSYDVLGFSNDEYLQFIASLKAFSYFFIALGRSYKDQVKDNNSEEINDRLMSEYMEWSICCLKFDVVHWFSEIAELAHEKFMLILSYFIDIYTHNPQQKIESNSFAGEGFLPPVTLLGDSILFSPLSFRYLLSFNNVLYSINKKNRELFDNRISQDLEPVLISQLSYLFSSFDDLKHEKNISYSSSEIDLLILSQKEKVCLSIQVKTTIAPDSSRSVSRVQDRIIEAHLQIQKFEDLGKENQLKLINSTFKTKLDDVKIINLIVVRSSAGSDKSWEINEKYRIVNYSVLAKILCRKKKSNSFSFMNFDEEILNEQELIMKESEWSVESEVLQIDEYEIEFPNIYYEHFKLAKENIELYKCYPNFQKSMF